MSCCNLLQKSQENVDCSIWAEKEKLYDISTNRLYYSAFQKTKYFLEKDGMDLFECYKSDRASKRCRENGFHEYVINKLVRYAESKRDMSAIANLSKMNGLRIKRNKADYQYSRITHDEYEKEVKANYEKIILCINRYIESN